MKKVAFCPADANNDKFFHQLENSLRKFHSPEELPLVRTTTNGDPTYFYKACPLEAKRLFNEYETVIKLDCDQIICGPLNEIWEGDFDVGVVLNDPNYPMIVQPYFNLGLVVMKNPEFVEHWYKLCSSPYFNVFQFREQDLFNILVNQNYQVKQLEDTAFYGEAAKPLWAQAYLQDNELWVPVPNQDNKRLNVIHFGGGSQDPMKGNYRIKFQPEVVKFIEGLIK